ncbi:hypothetical protein [Brachybacterium massiliense]|uniref:hypothetical protein n=1 Tax=Brachybacterium massiliense TaxID=1755098 RepID=UPI000B3BB6F6|nr:hypothetical protein [Brachybacterium massiliense]
MSHLTVSGKELRIALEVLAPMAASGFDVKLLAAVHLRSTPEKATLSATDRYGIGQWTFEPVNADGDLNLALSTTDVKRVLSVLPTFRRRDEDVNVTITADGDRITVETADGDRIVSTHVEGKTPDFDALFPTERGELAGVTLAPDKLARFTAAGRRIGQWDRKYSHAGLRLALTAEFRAVVVTLGELERFRGLLMPMRDGGAY